MYELSGSPEIVSDEPASAAFLRAQAERCRRHAKSIGDDMASRALEALAHQYDSQASSLEQG
ncbi:MAG TPA: hypothetical protein VMF58_12465 [Rhizomicrobium sp.]|nr:hypothetical protein [Rhizomicrobium sp.]